MGERFRRTPTVSRQRSVKCTNPHSGCPASDNPSGRSVCSKSGGGVGGVVSTGAYYGISRATGQSATVAGAAGALAPFFSDRRLKEDINLIGQSPNGINIYSFKYKGDDKIYQGVMADEVPEASIVGDYGYLMVDYSKVDVEFKQLN